MSRIPLDRRQFLTLPAALLLAPLAAATAPEIRHLLYTVDAGILGDVFTFHLPGRITETIDRSAGRYQVRAEGRGSRIANHLESRGVLRDGRWAPVAASGWFQVAGRQSRTEVRYDYERRVAHYHHRGETFLLRRLRAVDDTVAIPPGVHVDDVVSAVLNYADGLWPPAPDGRYTTHLVRRRRPAREGPDDAEPQYRAELVPFALHLEPDREPGHRVALIDLVPLSSWARQNAPARVVLGPDRRPAQVTASLILRSSITLRLRAAA